MISVLFVCMGNICRSPIAEGVFRQRVMEAGLQHAFKIDSAGTIGFHSGSPPDYRAQATTLLYGIDISQQRARKLLARDFEDYDYILAMDHENYREILSKISDVKHKNITLFLSHHSQPHSEEVPDPYYGSDDDFELVYSLANEAAKGLLDKIIINHNLR